MTALAGFWTFGGRHDPLARCRDMLESQRRYGTASPIVARDGDVALGKRPWPILPEDQFETAPVTGGGGRWTLSADLRLDNREELGAALGLAGARLAAM